MMIISPTFRSAVSDLGRLRTLGLIDYPERGGGGAAGVVPGVIDTAERCRIPMSITGFDNSAYLEGGLALEGPRK